MNPLSLLHSVLRSVFVGTLCGIVSLTTTAHSQTSANLGHQSWSTENGIPQSSVHQVFQSEDGYIWIATEGGVARFNGTTFKVFNHESDSAFINDDICCFAQDAHGAFWIGTSDGLLQYSANKFRRYSSADGLPSPEITSLAVADDGTLFVLTNNGAASFDGKTFSPLQLPSPIAPSAMTSASDGSVWFASSSGVFQYQHGRIRPTSLSLGQAGETVLGIGTLPDHSLWLRTRNRIVLLQGGHQQTLQAGHDLPATRIESFLADSRGNRWIGTNKGLFILNGRDSHPQLQPALGTNSILSLSEDREGNLWIGTETAGLHILRQQNFHTLPALSDHVITAIVQTTDDAMWIGTNGDGLDRWQSGQVQHLSTRNGLLSEVVLALAPGAHGDVWIGTPDGLNHIERGKITTFTSADGLPDDFIRSLLADDDGSLWIGTRRGLAHWQNKNVTTFNHDSGLKSDLIGALLKSHISSSPQILPHDLWIGTLDGLSRLREGKINTYTTKNGLSGNIITSLFEDSHGTLWIGTKSDGLSHSTADGFTALRRSDLPQRIDSILEDDRGYLWLSSTHGITRVSRSELVACGSSPNCNPHPSSYGYADGMPTEEASAIGHPTAWKTAQGLLWFATRKGVAITDPQHLSENRVAPPVVIERFIVDDVELIPSSTELILPPGHSRFVFEYAGLSYVVPAKVRYRYKLEGFDAEWTQAGSRRIAYYTNLPPRHYRFHVQAANNDGVWNETGATIAFYVRPPFYRRLWFLLLCVALIAAITVLLYRLRLRRLHSQFEAVLAERNRMAREIHDTLAQSFVGVSVQLELASQLLIQSQIPEARQQLDRTRAYVREGLAEARRSIWDLRAVTAQHTLPTRLTHLVEKSNVEPVTTHLDIGGTYHPLPPKIEEEVLRITQEALTNVARHANATHVSIDLRYHSTRLTLTISDNGRGFNASDDSLPAKGHFGLQGMRERAAHIDAQLNIESAADKGTRITLDVPILVEKGTKNNG
jgi:signal transduction histidine kinase/ligand-binding sensor domain-containing protein